MSLGTAVIASLLFRSISMGVSSSEVHHWPILYIHGSALSLYSIFHSNSIPFLPGWWYFYWYKILKTVSFSFAIHNSPSNQIRRYSTDLPWVIAFLFLASTEMFDWIYKLHTYSLCQQLPVLRLSVLSRVHFLVFNNMNRWRIF